MPVGTTYSLIDVIKIAQGFDQDKGYAVLPNDVVQDIIYELTRLSEIEKIRKRTGPQGEEVSPLPIGEIPAEIWNKLPGERDSERAMRVAQAMAEAKEEEADNEATS